MSSSGWINIKEQSPKHGQKCLLCIDGKISAGIADIQRYGDIMFNAIDIYGYEYNKTEDVFDTFALNELTQWMLLPNEQL